MQQDSFLFFGLVLVNMTTPEGREGEKANNLAFVKDQQVASLNYLARRNFPYCWPLGLDCKEVI